MDLKGLKESLQALYRVSTKSRQSWSKCDRWQIV